MATVQDTYFESARSVSSSTVTEAIAGIVAIVLTILGLAHVAPAWLVAIATIAVGVALVIRGSSVASEIARMVSQAGEQSAGLDGGTGWAAELLLGAAGIVLGILALLQVTPTDLVAIAAIGFGGALVLTGNVTTQVNLLRSGSQTGGVHPLMREVLSGAAGIQAVAGLQAVVLGILALAGFTPTVLVLIALLALGSFIFINGSALSGTMLAIFRR